MKFIDFFAGIGGFRFGMERAGHECVAFCEIDKFARESYKAIHNTEGETEYHDIRAISDEEFRKYRGQVDVICGGFPCQAFSQAGKRRGFEDTRGTLFFELARAAKQIQPRYLFFENVKGLLNHNEGKTFETILQTLDELGFDCEWQLCNSKDFGIPQNRERVFIVGHLRGSGGRAVFPITGESRPIFQESREIEIVGTTQSETSTSLGHRDVVMGTDGISGALCSTDYKQPKQIAIPVLTPDKKNKRQNGRHHKTEGEPMFTLTATDRHGIIQVGNVTHSDAMGGNPQRGRVYDPNGISPCLHTSQGGITVGQSPRYTKPPLKNLSRTLTSSKFGASILLKEKDNVTIRRLTPREYWRLQGYPDWAFDKASKVNSNTQLYKQAGNSVTVNVIEAIAKRLES